MSRSRFVMLPGLLGVLLAVVGLGLFAGVGAQSAQHRLSRRQLVAAYGRLPLSFAHNRGQALAGVDYVASGAGWTLGLGAGGVKLGVTRGRRSENVLTMTTPGGRLRAPLAGQQLPGRASYFSGSDRARWVSGAPTFARVVYRDVWPGVDLAFHGHQGALEYDFDLAPGADPGRVALRFAGARAVRSDGRGGAMIALAGGTVRVPAPRAEQGGHRVLSRLVASGKAIRVALGGYDHARALVVDPDLVYSTYLGGYEGTKIAVDSGGDAYVTGGDSNCKYGQGRAFVTKLNSTGTAVVYFAYLGSGGCTSASGIAVDSAGDAYVTGSGGVPTTPGAYQTTCSGGLNGFVTKLDPAGSGLVYSTNLCGGPANGIAVDSSGDAYVVTAGVLSTTPGAYQPTCGGGGSVAKLNSAGSALMYSTHLCGGRGTGIAVDSSGDAYVTGEAGPSFATTPGAYQTRYVTATPVHGYQTAVFVTKLNPAGSGLVYSTYLGPSGNDYENNQATGIAADSAGDAYVTGNAGPSFPTTPGAYQTRYGGGYNTDAFVTKLNPAGSRLAYSTYLGSWGSAQANGIAVDAAGDAYVTGDAGAAFPTTPGAYQTSYSGGWGDAFVTKLDPAGSSLLYSSYLHSARGLGIAIDSASGAYITGQAWGYFPITPGAPGGCGLSEVCTAAAKLSLGADVLWASRVSPRTFSLTGRRVNGRCVKATRGNRQYRSCTRAIKLQISYQLSAAAQVMFTVTRLLPGRLSHGRCVTPTRTNRKHRYCNRLAPVRGALTKNGKQGANSFTFNGWIGGKKLTPGRYQLTTTPSVSGQTGTQRTTAFTIAR